MKGCRPNTSLNDREPIVCSPEEVLRTSRGVGIRLLALGSRLVDLTAGGREFDPQA